MNEIGRFDKKKKYYGRNLAKLKRKTPEHHKNNNEVYMYLL